MEDEIEMATEAANADAQDHLVDTAPQDRHGEMMSTRIHQVETTERANARTDTPGEIHEMSEDGIGTAVIEVTEAIEE